MLKTPPKISSQSCPSQQKKKENDNRRERDREKERERERERERETAPCRKRSLPSTTHSPPPHGARQPWPTATQSCPVSPVWPDTTHASTASISATTPLSQFTIAYLSKTPTKMENRSTAESTGSMLASANTRNPSTSLANTISTQFRKISHALYEWGICCEMSCRGKRARAYEGAHNQTNLKSRRKKNTEKEEWQQDGHYSHHTGILVP